MARIDHEKYTVMQLLKASSIELAKRLETKTNCGYLMAQRIISGELPDISRLPVYQVFMRFGMDQKPAKIHATKVINCAK